MEQMDFNFILKLRDLFTFLLNLNFGTYFGFELTPLKIMEFSFLCAIIYSLTGIHFGGDKM